MRAALGRAARLIRQAVAFQHERHGRATRQVLSSLAESGACLLGWTELRPAEQENARVEVVRWLGPVLPWSPIDEWQAVWLRGHAAAAAASGVRGGLDDLLELTERRRHTAVDTPSSTNPSSPSMAVPALP